MKNSSFSYSPKAFFIILGLFCLINCESNNNYDDYAKKKEPPYVFTGELKMIKVPVPDGGIEFPIGINDDKTARVEKSFYISEILVTQALWDTVAKWAMIEKEVGKYYGLFYEHNEVDYYSDPEYFDYFGGDLPILNEHSQVKNSFGLGIAGVYVVPTWCNALTQWYNEKYGTNLTPVYTDEYGNPKRGIDNYDYARATKGRTGFRLPTNEEWK